MIYSWLTLLIITRYIPEKIADGKKHTTFRAITQGLMYLNPDISLLQVQSYINYINQSHTSEAMNTKEMLRTVQHEYNRIKDTGEITIHLTVKTLHFNKGVVLSKRGKQLLCNKINGLIKRYRSVRVIEKVKEELDLQGIPITNKLLSEKTGLGEKTIRRNKNYTAIDIATEIQSYNTDIHNGVMDSQILMET